MNNSLKALEYNVQYDLASLIKAPDRALYRCRIVYDRDKIDITYLPYTPRSVSTLQLLQAGHLDYALKYSDRDALDHLFEQRGDADDILLVDGQNILDTSIANIAFFDGKVWLTPRQPLLRGTTRARLLDEKKIIEADLTVEMLENFQGFALMNAMTGFQIIKDGIILPLQGESNAL